MIYDCQFGSEKSERHLLFSHLAQLSPGDVLVLDRGYFSYLVLTQAMKSGVNLVCRMQSGNVNQAVQEFWDSNQTDTVITYTPSIAAKYESKKQGYDVEITPIQLRLIKYTVGDETYVCSTTLMDKQIYPCDAFPSVYHGRWGSEELYKISKEFIDVEDFHSKSERGVKVLYA